MDVSRLNLKSCALLRRQHGKAQRGSAEDHMLFAFQFANNRCWDAYLTGFYRGCGYSGSGNRSQRRELAKLGTG